MLKGTYIFKQNGIEIGRSENVVTTTGKIAILKYIANPANEWASMLAVGAIEASEAVTDQTLYYEIARSPITLKSYAVVDSSPDIIIVKGTIDSSVVGNIYEVGIYPLTTTQTFGMRDQLIIDDFSTTSNWSGSSFTTNSFSPSTIYSNRVGSYSVNIPSGSTITRSNLSLNLSTYSTLDTLDLLVNVPSAGSGTLSITLTDVNGVSTSAFPSPASSFGGTTGYQIISIALPSSIFNMSTITSMSITTTGLGITLDAIRISTKSEVTDSTSLVSRSTLTTPIGKILGVPLDIEYYLQIG